MSELEPTPGANFPEHDADVFLAKENRRIMVEQGHSIGTYFFEVLGEEGDSIRVAISHVSAELAAELASLIHKDALILPASGPEQE